jgi:glycosyltransferase involved in cell wall biosynthesis
LRVLFVNDVGFQYGAGIALLRQIQSFLLIGHSVGAISWSQGVIEGAISVAPAGSKGTWAGLQTMPYLHLSQGISDDCIIETLLLEVKLWAPDVVIVGNLHGANWSLRIFQALREEGLTVVAYMHDCYLLTGRCAYTGFCGLFELGCNDTCPTWDQYPALEPDRISAEWRLRRALFCGNAGIPLATNSLWTLGMARRALPSLWHAECLYYGLDENVFKPVEKLFARELLGIPAEAFVVLSGAVDIADHRKGGDILREVVSRLRRRVHFVMFGNNSSGFDGVQGAGLVRDYRVMPLLYSSADVFVGTSVEEAFGQTFCEAAACSVPIVAFNVGGVPEIARHNINARLVTEISAESLVAEIEYLMEQPDLCHELGNAGRELVIDEFTLSRQAKRWMSYLAIIAGRQPM